MSVEKFANKIKQDDLSAYIKRVMWLALDERLDQAYCDFGLKDNKSFSSYGRFNISKGYECYRGILNKSKPHKTRVMNSTHLFTGHRLLGYSFYDNKKDAWRVAAEANAQLWYSQGPSGNVMVFISPYKSDGGQVDEREIVIGRYDDPNKISKKEIEIHFKRFFKYCYCVSMHSSLKMYNYLFRRYLLLLDFRFRGEYRGKILRFFERSCLVAFAGGAVWATLYAEGVL